MVGGHTITKPTINLSRVNMSSINNIARLSNISENSEPSEGTPNNSQEINEERSPIILPLPTTPLRYVRIYIYIYIFHTFCYTFCTIIICYIHAIILGKWSCM